MQQLDFSNFTGYAQTSSATTATRLHFPTSAEIAAAHAALD
jgi:hypothetical protein